MGDRLFDPPELRTPRLVLTPFRADDEHAARQVFVDDDEVTRYVGWRPLADDDAARRFVAREARAWRDAEPCRGWIVRSAESGEVVGSAVARRHEGSAEFSYVVVRKHWGQGLATEVVSALVERGRDDPAIRELWAICDIDNLASQRVLEKAGMTLDRRLPRHGRHNLSPEPRDCLRFSTRRNDA